MAENIISPGVFTRENDLSFLPQGIGAIGAAILGPTVKGPAFVPTVILRGFQEFEQKFGSYSSDTYVPLTVRNYLRNAASVTVVRVLGGGGWSLQDGQSVAIVNNYTKTIMTVLKPSKTLDTTTPDLTGTIGQGPIPASATTIPSISSSFVLKITGSNHSGYTDVSMSMDYTADNYILKSLGKAGNADNSKVGTNTYKDYAYPYMHFQEHTSESYDNVALTTDGMEVRAADVNVFTSSFTEGYDHAKTPWIQSQLINSSSMNLFKFHTLADGDDTNTSYKISVTNLKEPANIDGVEQYSQFSIQVRKFGDTDRTPTVLEQYNNLTLDPNNVNYISRVIGDRYHQWDNTQGKVLRYGDYPNRSNYVRVEVDPQVDGGSYSPKLSPKGFSAVDDTYYVSGYNCPSASYNGEQTLNGAYNTKAYLGWDFDRQDNANFNMPIPEETSANVAGNFNVENYSGHANSGLWAGSLSASIDTTGVNGPKNTQLKFSVPFQGGLDGMPPYRVLQTGEYITNDNVFGLDCSTVGGKGYTAYKKALDILANQDQYDINMLVLPGILKRLHAPVTTAATTMAEDRADTFYVMDLVSVDDSVNTAVGEADGLDSNYTATYFPWVSVLDPSMNKPIYVPPSVVVPGAIAASDSISAEWFAPAGLNRGVLGNVIEAKMTLNQADRDALYDGKVNPIATFPRTGVCIWGQKTLQTKSTALDRINVRRLLIAVKKFIASSSKYLVFEQNTIQTRNRFLNIVNPYLESVQQRQGLYAFRVVMDESNNTPDVIDRNQLVGAIYLQPTRTAEFIVLDFNVLPTGATFDV
jgi:hypothetical protein